MPHETASSSSSRRARRSPTTGCCSASAPSSNQSADAPGRNRTCDLALRRRALYPLSYRRRGRKGSVASGFVEVSARIVTLELAETFVISRDASDTADVLVVELRHSGVSGFGEAAPIERYEESVG